MSRQERFLIRVYRCLSVVNCLSGASSGRNCLQLFWNAVAWGLLGLAVSGCGEQKAAPAPAGGVAEVGGVPISVEAFTRLMQQRAGHNANRFTNIIEKEALLAEMIDGEATYAKAKGSGFDQRPDIQESIKRLVASRFLEQEASRQVTEPPIADRDLERYYHEHESKYTIPAKAHGALIFRRIPATATSEKRAEALSMAGKILDEAKASKDELAFGQVVQKYSEDQASRYRSGDMGWISQEGKLWGIEPALIEALFTLKKPGDFAPLVATENGVYVLKLVEKQPPSIRPFVGELKEEIRYLVTRQRQEQREKELHASLREGLAIRINQPVLESISPPSTTDSEAPPAVPDGGLTLQHE
jgi:hypothetical protein